MKRGMTANKRRKPATVKAGDVVLIGKAGIARPRHWFVANVLWADRHEILTEHQLPDSGEMQRQVLDIAYVRAVGPTRYLARYQRVCCEAVDALDRAIYDAEQALGAARDALWAKLDELELTVAPLEEE